MKPGYFDRIARLVAEREHELGRALTLDEQDEMKTRAAQEAHLEADRRLADKQPKPD
jgi:hypothetical protein